MDNARMREGAAALARQVQSAEQREQRRSWRKVTTVLSSLGVSRLTPAVREAATAALTEAGLVCEPAMAVVPRSGTVRLSTAVSAPVTVRAPSPQGSLNAGARSRTVDSTIITRATRWLPGAHLQAQDANEPTDSRTGGVLVLDVNPSADLDAAFDALRARCGPDLRRDMVADLLEADEVSKVRIEPGWNARLVSTFGVRVADEQSDRDDSEVDASGSKAGTVFFEVVEFVVGSDWILLCWHNPAKLLPDGSWTDSGTTLRDGVMARVARLWPIGADPTASGLAALIGTEMSSTHVLAQEEMSQWLEVWESEATTQVELETATLDSLRRALREYRRRLQAQDMSRHATPDGRWFSGKGATDGEQRMRALITQALRGLDALGQTVRSGTELVAMSQMREQLRLSNNAQHLAREAQDAAMKEQDRTTRFQNTLTVLGAVLLGPSLIAAIYGANVDLPGQNNVEGTLILIVGMILVSVASLVVVRRMQSDKYRRPS